GERIKRIRDWHTDARGTKADVKSWDLGWIRRKRHSCEGCIEKRADKFKVGKERQVFVTQIARKRTIVRLAICWRKRGCYRGKIIAEVIATSPVLGAGLVQLYSGVVDTGG